MPTILKQKPVREVKARYGKIGNDGVYRDTVAPYGIQRRDYMACCRFSNSIEKFGVKSSAISTLGNGAKGFRLRLIGSAREYEVMLEGGAAKLGLIQDHAPRRLLAEGSASSETTWTRFAEVLKEKEGGK